MAEIMAEITPVDIPAAEITSIVEAATGSRFIDRKNKQGGGYNNHDGDGGGGHSDQHLQLKQELSSQDQLPPHNFPGNGGGTLAVGEPGDQFNDDVPQQHHHQ
ncbi:uncharacterized protein LOC120431506 [Culex pipiens pallens]|uniref:uncharacterized protein LOC120431506 n=1 Tax=Culex pipiens pallens TaxID=42434 RepID=UPI001953F76E|nr:uncharacterized protein LOC120431506 [Culex pipiens pallens]